MLISENGPDASKWHICFASTLDGSHSGASALAAPGQANTAPAARVAIIATTRRDPADRLPSEFGAPRPTDSWWASFLAMTIGISESLNGPALRLLASPRSSRRDDQDLIVVLLATRPATSPQPAAVRPRGAAEPGLVRCLSYCAGWMPWCSSSMRARPAAGRPRRPHPGVDPG